MSGKTAVRRVESLSGSYYQKNGAIVFNNNVVAADSVFGHAAVPDVITAAAVNWITPSIIESYSSHGPVTISYPTQEIRAKPDITGVDGVSITGAGRILESVLRDQCCGAARSGGCRPDLGCTSRNDRPTR